MNRRAIKEERAILLRRYNEQQNQIIGSLIIDYNRHTGTATVQEPTTYMLGFSKGVAQYLLSQPLDPDEWFVCFLERGTRIIKGIERKILHWVIKSGSGEVIGFDEEPEVFKVEDWDVEQWGRVLVLRQIARGRLKAALITQEKPGNCLVVSAPKEYITTVEENTLKDISSRVRSNDIWPIGTLTEGQITKISEVKKGIIYKK